MKRLFNDKAVQLVLVGSLFVLLLLGLPQTVDWSAKITISVLVLGILLWTLETLPFGLTSFIVIVLLLVFQAVPLPTVFSGFSSPAIFLIVAGMMIAIGVNETALTKRLTYLILAHFGGKVGGLVAGLIIIMQFQAFFIPTTVVRVTMMMPIALLIISILKAEEGSNLQKLILFVVAFGGNISGTAVMTAAVGNILTVELLNAFLDVQISYFQWLLYAFPLWLLLIPAMILILFKSFPPEKTRFPELQASMRAELERLGPMTSAEKRCVSILIFTVLLWMTEPLHGLHPIVPALISVILMAFPKIGFSSWDKMIRINYDTVLLLGTTLSLGYALNESGALNYIGKVFDFPVVMELFANPLLAVIFVIVVTQVYHLGVSNVSTAVVTLLPVLFGVAVRAGIDPVLIGYTAAITSLFGFIFVVETMPNVVVHATGKVSQRDFIIPGIWATVAATLLTVLVAATWWQWIGFL